MLGATMLSSSSYGMQAEVTAIVCESERPSLSEADIQPIEDIEELQELDAAAVQQIIIEKEQESSAHDESSALRIAALHSRELLDWVFARNPQVKIDAVDRTVGWTALHAACSWGQVTSVEWLLAKGAQIEFLDPMGMTPFLLAVWVDI